ncbi:rhodanese-like domain-containing protein, partial [Raoultella sp. 18084]|uniref:rhodanese-like domain-containing protein n=1 Tax=Raoultella sp. 18084 TaxID=2681416 RepID=UPI002105C6AC
LKLVTDGDTVSATLGLMTRVAPPEAVWREKLAQLVELQNTLHAEAAAAADRTQSRTRLTAGALVALAVALGLLIAWRTTASITQPIGRAVVVAERIARGDDIVVVDSRTPEEFAAFSLPFAHSVPGAELVYRIGELAPDPGTFVVVNCAGRTRSIVGAQTLIDAGIPNRVASLRNGTMDWLLTGRTLAHGRSTPLPEPSPGTLAAARERAAAVAQRAGVQRIDAA